jgi:hypothetical protein
LVLLVIADQDVREPFAEVKDVHRACIEDVLV